MTRTTTPTPDPIDVHVGGRVRLRRTLLGMSQSTLGDALDLTFQQIQKYERGANRMGASRLFRVSQTLDVPVSFFFDGIDHDGTVPQTADDNQLSRRETLELVRAYYKIEAPVRKRLFEMVKAMGAATPEVDGRK